MNRKLKKLMKNTYGNSYPQKKNAFIQQMLSEPTWRRLHPFSSFFALHPVIVPISAVFSAVAVCLIMIVVGFGKGKAPVPDTPPEIITELTVTTSVGTNSPAISTESSETYTADTVSKSPKNTQTKNKTTTITSSVSSKSAGSAKSSEKNKNIQTASADNPKAPNSVTTSIYYSNFFGHSYTEVNDFSSLEMYGYPDSNVFIDAFKAEYEKKEHDISFDEVLERYEEATGQSLSADVMDQLVMSLLCWNDDSNVIEGDITDIQYTSYEGKPWTICEITVSHVYRFELTYKNDYYIINKGDKLNIAMPGGYMSVSEYISLNPDDKLFKGWSRERIENTVIYEAGSNQTEIKTGDHYGFFLELCELDLPYDNLYKRKMMCDIAQFTVNNGEFVSCNSNYSNFRADTERFADNRTWKYFYDSDSDRCIAFRDDSFLLFGAVSCFSVNPDGRLTYLDHFYTDDGFFPFHEPYGEEEIYSYTGSVISGKDFILTWTDSGVTLQYKFDYLYDDLTEIKFSIPK